MRRGKEYGDRPSSLKTLFLSSMDCEARTRVCNLFLLEACHLELNGALCTDTFTDSAAIFAMELCRQMTGKILDSFTVRLGSSVVRLL